MENSETDEVTLNYHKNGKEIIINVGFADYSQKSQINQQIEKIRNE